MSDGASSLPTADQILSALDQTGFVLEYRVAQALQKLGFYTYLNHPFTDPQSGKSREIDVLAETYSDAGEDDLHKALINATLVVECKNYQDPLLTIGQGNQLMFHNDKPLITFDPLEFDFTNRRAEDYGGIRSALDLGGLPSSRTEGFIAGQLIRMNRNHGTWQAGNDSVFDSIVYPLAKAAEYEAAEMAKGDGDPDTESWKVPSFNYIFPVLVTAGSIFAVDVVPNGTPTVEKVKWVPLVRYFSESTFIMDVVSFDSLAEYVRQRIVPTLEEAHQAIASKMHFLNPEWLQQQYGESSDAAFTEWLEDFRSS